MSGETTSEQPHRRSWPHRLALTVLVAIATFGFLFVGLIGAMGTRNFAESQCREVSRELRPENGRLIIRDTLFPPSIVCEFGDDQVGSRLNWPIILGPVALAMYVIFWVRLYRFVDRVFRRS